MKYEKTVDRQRPRIIQIYWEVIWTVAVTLASLGTHRVCLYHRCKQESPAIADKPARRESLPKIAPIRRAYNLAADNTGLSSFV